MTEKPLTPEDAGDASGSAPGGQDPPAADDAPATVVDVPAPVAKDPPAAASADEAAETHGADAGDAAPAAASDGAPAAAPPSPPDTPAAPPLPEPVTPPGISIGADRPEIVVGAAFAAGFLLALILRRLAR